MEPGEDDFASELEWPGYEPPSEPANAAAPAPNPSIDGESNADAPDVPAVGSDTAADNGADDFVTATMPEPAAPAATMALLPNLARRIDDLGVGLANASMRIDALGVATSSLHSSLSDRLAEYGEMAAKLARSQADTIDEYRHGNDRSLTEMRRSNSSNEAVLRKLSGRADELLRDSEALADLIREVGSVAPAPQTDGADLAPLLAQISEKMDGAVRELLKSFNRVEAVVRTPKDNDSNMVGELALLRAEVRKLKRPDIEGVLASLRDEVQQLTLPDIGSELASLREEVQQFQAARYRERVGVVAGGSAATHTARYRERAGVFAG